MSGRPRTTSFAESCKPVPQPSAFGSMKVSSKYPPPSYSEPPLPTSPPARLSPVRTGLACQANRRHKNAREEKKKISLTCIVFILALPFTEKGVSRAEIWPLLKGASSLMLPTSGPVSLTGISRPRRAGQGQAEPGHWVEVLEEERGVLAPGQVIQAHSSPPFLIGVDLV